MRPLLWLRLAVQEGNSAMNHKEYEQAYPAREVVVAPEDHLHVAESYWDAQNALDHIESTDAAVCDLVTHGGKFYVVHKD